MMSRISFCNATILKKNLSRFWPLMALCAFICFMLLPMGITEIDDYSVFWQLTDVIGGFLPLGIFCYAPLCAACVFGYLHKSRSSNMLHALPLTRKKLFASNFCSGLLLFLLPWVAVCLVTFFVFVANGIRLDILLSAFAVGVLEYLFFYALAAFCMLLCGKTVYGILMYLFLNIGIALMEIMIVGVVKPFLYGIEVEFGVLSEFLPLIYIMWHTVWGFDNKYTNSKIHASLYCDWLYLGIMTAIAIGLIALAWLLYRKRNMENVGNPIAYPRLQAVVHVVVALFAALALGIFIYQILFASSEDSSIGTRWILSLMTGGFIGYFGVEMLLRKTPRVFHKKTFIGYGIFAAVLTLTMLCFRFDWLNIVGYVPESNSVTVTYSHYEYDYRETTITLTEPEAIETIRALHREIVENREELEYGRDKYDAKYDLYYVTLSYKKDNGTVVEREYELRNFIGYEKCAEIYNGFEAFLKDARTATTYIRSMELCKNCALFLATSDGDTSRFRNTSVFDEIREAMLQDVAEGNLDLMTLCAAQRYMVAIFESNYSMKNFTSDYKSGYLMEARRVNGAYEDDCFKVVYIPEAAIHTYALLAELAN